MSGDADRVWELMIELGRLRSFRDPLAGLGELELTGPQAHAVLWLGIDGPLPVSVLARRIGSSVPACTGIVDRLEKIDVVSRSRPPGDRRVVLVGLTGQGEQLSSLFTAGIHDKLSSLLGALGARDQRALVAILGRLVDAFKQTPEPGS